MNLLISIILSYGMYFASFSGSVNELNRKPFPDDSFKYTILGGYTNFGIPYAGFSMTRGDYRFHLFMLSSGKMTKTDVQGNVLGDVYYNGIILSAGREIYRDSLNVLYVEPGIYLETSDGWYNPGIGFSLKYRRWIYERLMGMVHIRHLGLSLNPRTPLDFDAVFAITYLKYGIDPFFSIDVSPERKLNYYGGITIPLHRVFSASFFYTDAYRELRFGSGSDLLNGVSFGINVHTQLMKLTYVAGFQGEAGITHTVEVRFLK